MNPNHQKTTVCIVVDAMGYHSRAFCDGCAEAARAHGWDIRLVLTSNLNSPSVLSACDGIIARGLSEHGYDVLRHSGKTVVEAAVKGTGEPRFSSIDCDERALAETAARHFLERGYRRFAFCGFRGVAFSDVREQFFRDVLARRGLPVSCYPQGGVRFAGKRLSEAAVAHDSRPVRSLGEWVRTLEGPVAVFCANDYRAYQLQLACADAGIAVPKQVAILGVDNDLLYCGFNRPALSSIDIDASAIGRKAVDVMARQLSLPPSERRPTHAESRIGRVILRGSTAFYPMGPKWLSDALTFIDENFAKISASDVYRRVRLSHTSVDGAFAKTLHTTVQKRILAVRMDEARHLLANGSAHIAEISDMLGFPSVQYFSNLFKLRFNSTPAAYRKAARSG